MVKFGVKSGGEIRKLGMRLVNPDFKGFGETNYAATEHPWAPIGEGNDDWPDAVAALGEIGGAV